MKHVLGVAGVLVACALGLGVQSETARPGAERPQRTQKPLEPTTVTDLTGILSTRAVWPVGTPLYVSINAASVVDDRPHILRVQGDWKHAPPIEQYLHSAATLVCPGPDTTWSDRKFLAGVPSNPEMPVTFIVKVSHPQGPAPKGATPPRSPLTLPVQIKGTIDELLKGVRLPDLDEALTKELNATFYRNGWNSDRVPRLWLGTYTNCEGEKETEYPGICHVLAKHPDTTFAVRLEVLRDSKVVARAFAWWRGTDKFVTPYEGMLSVEGADGTLTMPPIQGGTWSLRIKADPELALRDFESNQYWTGDIIVPLRVVDGSDWESLRANGEDKRP